MKQRIFTRRQAIEEGTVILKEAGIEEAALDAWYLLEYVTGISRAAYYGGPDKEIDCAQAERYLECIEKRRLRVPLQHITGEQEFMGYSFYVNEHVLIPRQDTETLAEEAAETVRRKIRGGAYGDIRELKVLDMCTGSGCILISVMKLCPGITGVGCDISKEALVVAKRNAERLDVEAEWVCSDLFSVLKESKENENQEDAVQDEDLQGEDLLKRDGRRYDVIVSNPPYIRSDEIEKLQDEVRLYDPRIALDGREDGLYFYRRIVADSIFYIKDGGSLLFEIGHDQGDAVSELMRTYGYTHVSVKKDLAGLDRVVQGMYNGKCCGNI